jgi:hypothetical protein
MIILDKTTKVQFQGNFDTIKVGIDEKNISHFFRMIANLYQDPVTAVLREIGANCVDAIKEAKTENLGWELHLPSRMDGNVRFVDNGVGISHEQMIRIYSIIGASSKREDNNLIGGFGVGKWSLCSLVNNFQAISTYNGTRTYYFICLQSNGLPDIKVIKQESTNNRNGFEVKFLCPDKYVYEFNNKVEKTYRFFSIKPKVLCDGVQKAIPYNNEKTLMESKDIGFQIFEGSGEAVIVMGGVGYRIPQETLKENKKFSKYESLLHQNIAIHVPIGEYSITPSREAIQLDDLTLTRLQAKLEDVINSFIPELQKEMDKFDGNTWDAKLKIKSLRDKFSFLPDTIKLNWNGMPLTASGIQVKATPVCGYFSQTYYRKIGFDKEIKELIPSKSSFLFLDDLGKGGVGRIKLFLNEKKNQERYTGFSAYLLNKKDKDSFVKETGWVGEFTRTSTLPAPAKKVKAGTGVGAADPKAFRMRSERNWGVNDCLMTYDNLVSRVKDADQFVLFPMFANKIAERPATATDNIIELISKKLKKKVAALFLTQKEYDAFKDETLDGKPLVKIHKLLENTTFCEYLNKLNSRIDWDEFIKSFGSNWNLRNMPNMLVSFKSKLDSQHIISEYIKEVFSIASDKSSPKELSINSIGIIKHLNKDVLVETDNVKKDTIEKIKTMQDKICKIYPLFPIISSNYYKGSQLEDAVLEYVKLIDSKNE